MKFKSNCFLLKLIWVFLSVFASSQFNQCQAQLDTLHYFPPLGVVDLSNVKPGHVHIYISTPSVEDVSFEIYDAAETELLQSGTLNNSNPYRYDSFGVNSGVAVFPNDLNSVLTQDAGFKVRASQNVFAHLRILSLDEAQGGSITSKGTNAFGTTFRLGSIPNLSANEYKGSTFGFVATEDETEVSIDLTSKNVSLAGNSPPSANSIITVNLNKGESYVVRCESTDSPNNLDGLIGGLVTSNKSIVLNTGSLCGASALTNGRDYAIDQVTDLKRLGTEYVFVRGNGDDLNERPLIVAHYDETEVYANNSITPVAVLNAGEYYSFNGNLFVENVLYVRTSKTVFAYQILAGGEQNNVNGMNFMPDIQCPVDSVVDLIPDCNKIGNTIFTGGISMITEHDAEVKINGIPVDFLPTTITTFDGEELDVYRKLGVVGNLKIEADSWILVSSFGASPPAGYGGYYSGFETYKEFYQEVDLCQGDSILIGESVYTKPGTYFDKLYDSGGCDSLVITELHIHQVQDQNENVELCQGDSIEIHGVFYKDQGSYSSNLIDQNGCEIEFLLHLDVNPSYEFTAEVSMCQNEEYQFGEDFYTESGIYTRNLTTVEGCDSILNLNLLVFPQVVTTNDIMLCQGETYMEGDSNYSTDGVYSNVYSSIHGCDSIVVTELNVIVQDTTIIDAWICEGLSFDYGGYTYSDPGTYMHQLENEAGCDSIVILELTVLPSFQFVNHMVICSEDSLPNLSGTYDPIQNQFVDSLVTINGCDSLVITQLEFMSPLDSFPSEVTICSGEAYVASVGSPNENSEIEWSTGSHEESVEIYTAGVYWVSISNQNCQASDTIYVTVQNRPSDLVETFSLCNDSELTLDASHAQGEVVWEDGTISESLNVDNGGIYTAQIHNECGESVYSAEVILEECQCKLFIPNTVTIDKNGLNEKFGVVHSECDFIDYDIEIISRWGISVFKSSDPDDWWDGTDANSSLLVADGIYTYIVTYHIRDFKNRIFTEKLYGSVCVLR